MNNKYLPKTDHSVAYVYFNYLRIKGYDNKSIFYLFVLFILYIGIK